MTFHPFRYLRTLLPRSLFGRFVIILLTPLLFLQIILGYIFFDRHTETILRVLSETIAGDIALVSQMVKEGKAPLTVRSMAEKHLKLHLHYKDKEKLKEIGQSRDTWLYEHMAKALNEQLFEPYFIRMNRDTIFIDVQLEFGVLHIELPRKRLLSKTTYLVLIWTTASALLLFIVAVLFMRNQIKPIRQLADAAERFGKGQEIVEFKPQGALEVRKAAMAFNQMRSRILRFVEERTHQLAGISHDLRTPLSRMKLQLALLPQNPDIEHLREDVEEMIMMIQGFLDYARGTLNEEKEEVELKTFLKAILSEWHTHHSLPVSLIMEQEVTLHLKKQFFNRMLTNILLNSQKHGKRALVHVHVRPTNILMFVDDDGSGIGEADREIVFQPFQRLDPARNAETGGVGLGLAIVRDAVHTHGGRIQLDQAEIGGLRVKIWLPR